LTLTVETDDQIPDCVLESDQQTSRFSVPCSESSCDAVTNTSYQNLTDFQSSRADMADDEREDEPSFRIGFTLKLFFFNFDF